MPQSNSGSVDSNPLGLCAGARILLQMFVQNPGHETDHLPMGDRRQLRQLAGGANNSPCVDRCGLVCISISCTDGKMLRLYHGRFHRISRCRHQALQPQQGRAVHIGQTLLPHLAADNRIKHPLWNLQCGRPVQFVSHATQNRTATASRFDLDAHLLPIPWVPAVLHFSNAGFMGVLYPTCTTSTALMLA
jgi:hypothetical protein